MRRATLIAAKYGRIFGFLFIMFGVLKMLGGDFGGGLWIAFIGWFLESAASAQVQQVMLQAALAGHTVGQAMNRRHHRAGQSSRCSNWWMTTFSAAGDALCRQPRRPDRRRVMIIGRLKQVPPTMGHDDRPAADRSAKLAQERESQLRAMDRADANRPRRRESTPGHERRSCRRRNAEDAET